MANYIGLTLFSPQGDTIEIISFLEQFNMYQAKQTNEKGITTTPLLSESDIKRLIECQETIKQSIKLQNEWKQQEAAKQESESIGEFKIDDPKQHARAKKTLNTEMYYKHLKKVMKRKDYIKSLLNENVTPVNDKGKWYFYFEDGSFIQVTKTEIEYYEYLKSIS